VLIEADGIGRHPPDTETTVYFCTLEALQNITKYAGATQAAIRLDCPDGSLQVTITDDGGSTPPKRRGNLACKAWPTAWPRSAAPSTSTHNPDTEPP
jgi:signal transduction histidine kinase